MRDEATVWPRGGPDEVGDADADEHDGQPGHGRPPRVFMASTATPMPSRRTRWDTADGLIASCRAMSCWLSPCISPPRIAREVVDMEPTMKSRQPSAAWTAATSSGGSTEEMYAVRDVRVCALRARSSALVIASRAAQ